MPTLHDFLTQWGWPETVVMCVIIGITVAMREWHHIRRLFP